MNEMWECDASINADIFLEYVEIYTPTMQLAWKINEEGEKELFQLHNSSSGKQEWMKIQTIE